MPKSKIEIKIESFGRYTGWDRKSKQLPKPLEFTTTIPAEPDAEFGMVLHILKGKGTILNFCITHPPIKDENGKLMPDFTGEYHINSNNYKFFIGDCVWPPVEDKIGLWEVNVKLNNKIVAQKTFDIVPVVK